MVLNGQERPSNWVLENLVVRRNTESGDGALLAEAGLCRPGLAGLTLVDTCEEVSYTGGGVVASSPPTLQRTLQTVRCVACLLEASGRRGRTTSLRISAEGQILRYCIAFCFLDVVSDFVWIPTPLRRPRSCKTCVFQVSRFHRLFPPKNSFDSL